MRVSIFRSKYALIYRIKRLAIQLEQSQTMTKHQSSKLPPVRYAEQTELLSKPGIIDWRPLIALGQYPPELASHIVLIQRCGRDARPRV
jgi:hypothetical protein